MPSSFTDKVTRKFMRNGLHGGRCMAYGRTYESEEKPLIAVDYNSLYSVVIQELEKFPDI